MPTDREIKQLVLTVAKKIKFDQNAPYTVRRRKTNDVKDSRGGTTSGDEYETRTITNMRTQPLSDQDYNRLPEGFREKSWRFVEVVPEKVGSLPSSTDEFLDFGDQIQYKGHWFEVRFINDWDLIQGCKAEFVE